MGKSWDRGWQRPGEEFAGRGDGGLDPLQWGVRGDRGEDGSCGDLLGEHGGEPGQGLAVVVGQVRDGYAERGHGLD